MKTSSFIVLLILLISNGLNAQDVPGCTDQQANNYDPQANVNDGSCTYNPSLYNPDFKYILPASLEETSGLIYYDGALWTINDSGNDPILFKLDTTNGNIVQEITINNASNVDWESLAQDDDHIYIGDFGNNSGNRDNLGIYVVLKNDLPESGNGSVSSTHISFTYPDYPGRINKRGENNFDCEALLVIEDSLYLFSKNWNDNQTKLYRLPKLEGTYVAEKIYTYNTSGLITGADYNEESKEITLVGYSRDTKFPFLWLLFDFHDNLVFSGNKRRIDLLNLGGCQTEAITYIQGKNGVISNENNFLYNQSLHDFYTGNWTNLEPTGFGEIQADNFDFTLSPNPVSGNKLSVNMNKLPRGDYQIKVYDTLGNLVQIKEYGIKTNKSELKVKIKVGNLEPGLYFVRMQSVNTIVEKKFIKQ